MNMGVDAKLGEEILGEREEKKKEGEDEEEAEEEINYDKILQSSPDRGWKKKMNSDFYYFISK